MKSILLYLSIFFPYGFLQSQNTNSRGIIQYKQTLVIDTVQNAMIETEGVLYFDIEKKQSLYIWDKKNQKSKQTLQKMDDGTIKGTFTQGSPGTDTLGRRVYKAFDTNTIYVRDKLSQWYLISDTVTIKWEVTNESKISHNMTLQKAKGDFRGRNYTVWFNPKIPVKEGPWKLRGLPGLILEAHDEKNHVKFELIRMEIPSEFQENYNMPEHCIEINYKQFFEKKINALKEEPKKFESMLKQHGATFTGTSRYNLIERSL